MPISLAIGYLLDMGPMQLHAKKKGTSKGIDHFLPCGRKAGIVNQSPKIRSTKSWAVMRRGILSVFQAFMLFLFMEAPAWGQAIGQNSLRKPLGSLSTVGGVMVNSSAAAAGQTVFAGDSLTTNDSGIATVTISGKGAFKIAPNSQVEFPGSSRYSAQLKNGTVVMNTFIERSDVALRIGEYIVMAAPRAQQAAAMVKQDSDGSGLVSCLAGEVQVLAIQGDTALFLQAGQSTSISSGGQTVAVNAASPPTIPASTIPVVKKHWGWIMLGVAGAGGAAGAALAAGGGGSHPISPSAP